MRPSKGKGHLVKRGGKSASAGNSTNYLTALLQRIESRKAVVGIVGLGYVGLPLMLRFSEVGYRVLGLDIDKSKVDALNAGRSYIEHIKGEHIKRARKAGFEATADFSRAKEADALILCVPTPLNK